MNALRQLGFAVQEQHNGNLMVTKPAQYDERIFFETAKKQETHIRHLHAVRLSLEDAFMQAIGRGEAS